MTQDLFYKVSAMDKAGNESSKSTAVSFTIDKSSPSLPSNISTPPYVTQLLSSYMG